MPCKAISVIITKQYSGYLPQICEDYCCWPALSLLFLKLILISPSVGFLFKLQSAMCFNNANVCFKQLTPLSFSPVKVRMSKWQLHLPSQVSLHIHKNLSPFTKDFRAEEQINESIG